MSLFSLQAERGEEYSFDPCDRFAAKKYQFVTRSESGPKYWVFNTLSWNYLRSWSKLRGVRLSVRSATLWRRETPGE
jgi:hypothetical protein